MLKKILISTLVLNLGVLVGRLSGFAREMFVAGTFGATSEADQIILMLTLPDLLVNLLLGGALSAVLIPEMTQRAEQAKKILFQSLLLLGVFFIGVAISLSWQSEFFVKILAPGLTEQSLKNTASLVSWTVWIIPLTVWAGATTAYLHSINSFAISSLGTLIVNLTIILGLVVTYYDYGSLYTVAIFVVIGGGLRFVSQLSVIGVSWHPIMSIQPFLLHKSFLIRYFQAAFSSGLLFLLPFIARAYASDLESGSIATLNYGMKLVEFPLLLTVTFLSVVLFPRLSKSFGVNQVLHHNLIQYGLQITLLLAVFAMLVLMMINQDYASLVYGYGSMTEQNVENVAVVSHVGLMMLPLQGLALFITAILHSRNNIKTPMVINLIGLIFFILVMQLDYLTKDLSSITLALVVSYALVLVLFLIVTKVDKIRVATMFLDKSFLVSFGISISVLYALISIILGFQISSLLTMISSFFAGVFSLLLVVFTNNNFFRIIRVRSIND
jgi:murein biosynthesis integral membrane protein MurJ